MPEIRYFIVTQTREVKVSANTSLDAATTALTAFDDTPGLGAPGDIRSEVREIGLKVEEVR